MSHRCAMHAPRNRFGSRETPALYSTGTHPKQTATADLRTPLQFLKGVGPRRAAQLERKGLRTVEDALFFLPLRHEDRTRLVPFRSLQPGQVATCSGTIVGLSPPPPGRSRAQQRLHPRAGSEVLEPPLQVRPGRAAVVGLA